MEWNWRTHEKKSIYPKPGLHRKNSKIRRELAKGLCEICGNLGNEIHHKDFSKDNHELSNLMLVCINCHRNLHAHHNGLYGISDLAAQWKVSRSLVSRWYHQGRLSMPTQLNRRGVPFWKTIPVKPLPKLSGRPKVLEAYTKKR